MSRSGGIRCALALSAAALALVLTACGSIPADPDGSLDVLTGGVLRAGASPSAGLVETEGTEPTGPLVDLVDGFARERDARIEWVVGSEEDLVAALEQGDLDIAVGGMTDATPWADRVGVTRGYPGVEGSDGRAIALLVPLGENALLSALELYLDGQVGS